MTGRSITFPGIGSTDAVRLAMFGTYMVLLGLTIALIGAACGN